MLLQAISDESNSAKPSDESRNGPQIDKNNCIEAHMLNYALAPGWTVHVTRDGRLYYCNHVTRTAGWLPPAEAWKCSEDALPFGWEQALDESGRSYYINHVNRTTTYERPMVKSFEPLLVPEPRIVTLERSAALGFGFVAGSEKPVIVRFVTEGGPSVDKLMPGDQILTVNGEDVKLAPREHVISLVRACSETVNLVVCQPLEQQGGRKSTLLSASKKARLRSKPCRVRFAESVSVNGAPLFPPSAFSMGDLYVAPIANVLKVFLENGQTKSFKYDAWTTVHDVLTSLESKLCLQATEHFSLVVEHIKSLKRNKLTLLNPDDTLARIASRPGAHKLRCLFRVTFVPLSAAALAQRDLNALDYLYIQCCNDVIQERFAPELQYDTALRLAALQVYQHILANNMSAMKLTVKTIEKEFGLERFVPASLLENMKRKEVKKLIGHFLKLHSNMAGPGKQLTALQTKLHYLDIVSQLPSYGAKCFSSGRRGDVMERVILVSPKFGISQITETRNALPAPLANIQDIRQLEIRSDDEYSRNILITLRNGKLISILLDERDANELVLVLGGYFRLATGQLLAVDQEESNNIPVENLAPPYISQHKVVPEKWSYINQMSMKSICFTPQPSYQMANRKTNGLYNTMGRQSKPIMMHNHHQQQQQGYSNSLDSNMNNSLSNRNLDNKFNNIAYDLHNVVSMEILETNDDGAIVDTKNEEVLKRVQEMQQLVENSENYLNEHEQNYVERQQQQRRPPPPLLEWQESSCGSGDIDGSSDTDSLLTEETLSKLKHSDSLLLLTKESQYYFSTAAIEMLRTEINQSESDNDSLYTPQLSPNNGDSGNNKISRISFGLRSPDNSAAADADDDITRNFDDLSTLKSINNTTTALASVNNNNKNMYVFDPDIIDLTLLPPPATPDSLDCALPVPINVAPSRFADSMERLNRLEKYNDQQDLEEFLASVTVPPPTQKLTPAIELTPEEIMSYIIPPPPTIRADIIDEENHTSSIEDYDTMTTKPTNVIEYTTINRKGPFSCCAISKSEKKCSIDTNNTEPMIKLPPRRSLDEKPPERPPKTVSPAPPPSQQLGRQRSQSLSTYSSNINDLPPTLPPRGETNQHQMSSTSRLFLPPKKPPLPPVPPLEILRQKKNSVLQQQNKPQPEIRTAGIIGSPRLQRNRMINNDLDVSTSSNRRQDASTDDNSDNNKLSAVVAARHVNTAVSTPTSPHLGRGAQLTMASVSILPSPDSSAIATDEHSYCNEDTILLLSSSSSSNEQNSKNCLMRNNYCCNSTRENLLAKTDVAMVSLLLRLDQVAAQCNAAQIHGGGRLISEEKFQATKDELTSQSLQLVTSSKMLVIAMSDPTLPDLPENLAICLTILRRLTELSQDLTDHTIAPLQTRNLILKIHDVIAAFRHLLTSNIDRSSRQAIEKHLAAQADCLANVLATLLRSLRVFSP